jgi:hypothetical protein
MKPKPTLFSEKHRPIAIRIFKHFVGHKCLKESRNQTCLPKYVRAAAGRFAGEKNGKKCGMRLNIAQINAKMAQRNNSPCY